MVASDVVTFGTGATKSGGEKLDYEGFLSYPVLRRYAEYMHKHRTQADGSVRASDNWQQGIPIAELMKSLWRHVTDVWGAHRGIIGQDTLEDSLCAVIFNAMAYLHEVLKKDVPGVPAEPDYPDDKCWCSLCLVEEPNGRLLTPGARWRQLPNGKAQERESAKYPWVYPSYVP